ncbi:hypothetical protein EIP91_004400 [Steccherinum ochraceum]|uniref:RlpA-like protein double-psi beta-barrel domain-containing protein n=1 Tax=Steccherinum ochraceum TaxID=92696 RepID=A0A4R0RWG9_9APHY|nr:hypothetical protein EIP91_004400 [Steccherinum ochraceum]
MASLLALCFVALVTLCLGSPIASEVQLEKRANVGRATFYNVGEGACGEFNVPTDPVVAISTALFGAQFPGPHCGQGVTITNTQNGKTVRGTVLDECAVCGAFDLDLSEGLFLQLTPSLSAGEIPVNWSFDD